MTDEEIEREVRYNKADELYVDSLMDLMQPKVSLIPQT